jgi:hypothetical protein
MQLHPAKSFELRAPVVSRTTLTNQTLQGATEHRAANALSHFQPQARARKCRRQRVDVLLRAA